MGIAAEKLTLAGFLEWENAQNSRHEYFQGDVYAMTGARRAHGEVVGTVFAALKQYLRGSPCRAYMEGMKLQVADDAVFYADVLSRAMRPICVPIWCSAPPRWWWKCSHRQRQHLTKV